MDSLPLSHQGSPQHIFNAHQQAVHLSFLISAWNIYYCTVCWPGKKKKKKHVIYYQINSEVPDSGKKKKQKQKKQSNRWEIGKQ